MRDWLCNQRKKMGLTQGQIAGKLDISPSYYAYIENGERQKKMDISLLSRLSVIFHIPIRQIVELEEKWREGQK